MKIKHIILYFSAVVLLVACYDDDTLTDSIIKDKNVALTEVDTWINTQLTTPYNIEVVYKWDDDDTDLSKNLVPPDEDKVIPYLEVLKKLWIDTYVEQAGADFLKTLAPKQIMLIGSNSFNADGTITGGTAEGGRKIVLYAVNRFDAGDKESLTKMIHVVHHEFAHIMHQTKAYNEDFKQITPNGYTSTWNNTYLKDARNAGFISRYAQMNTNEDFVEMIANFLLSSPEEWEDILSSIEKTEGLEALKQKEANVADYLMQNWGIDMYDFRDLLTLAIADLTENNQTN